MKIVLGPLGYFGKHMWEIRLKDVTKFSLQVLQSRQTCNVDIKS